jgi:hypothetical protein
MDRTPRLDPTRRAARWRSAAWTVPRVGNTTSQRRALPYQHGARQSATAPITFAHVLESRGEEGVAAQIVLVRRQGTGRPVCTPLGTGAASLVSVCGARCRKRMSWGAHRTALSQIRWQPSLAYGSVVSGARRGFSHVKLRGNSCDLALVQRPKCDTRQERGGQRNQSAVSLTPAAQPPQLAPAKLVQFLKGRSSRLLQQEFRTCASGTGASICGREDISVRRWARSTSRR